jgi:transposase-like protein
MSSVLCEPYFQDEQAAFDRLEAIIWPQGPVCPHCGAMSRIGALKGVRSKPSRKHPEGVERLGLKKCYDCRNQFTVRKGTVFEDSHAPLHLWFQAAYLLMSSKKGISSNQLHRVLGVQLKTAWFMSHRLREALRIIGSGPLGGEGRVVEADETFVGRLQGMPKQPKGTSASSYKNTVLTPVERGGSARSFHVEGTSIADLQPIIRANIARETQLMTDEWRAYDEIGSEFASHDTVSHKDEEYARYEGERLISTNTVEGYYSVFKRGMKGVYQHCSEKHLHRYLAEFDFRYTHRVRLGVDDVMRTVIALKGIKGKRLTYRNPDRTLDA